jgi:hypothetical protein
MFFNDRITQMMFAIMIAANMCLQGGTTVDISPYVPVTAVAVEVKVTMTSASGTLIIYSPGYEAQQASFTNQDRFGVVPMPSRSCA